MKRILEEGHDIGNHTYDHENGWKTGKAQYAQSVVRCDDVLLPYKTNLFRPPYGKITHAQVRALSDRTIVMWDVLTRDYDTNLSSEKCLTIAKKRVRNGSVVVFHDSYKAMKNMEKVLPDFIRHCQEQGFQFSKFNSQ